MISEKKKVFTEIETDFSAKIGNSNAFSGRITTSTSQLRHPISFGWGLFSFFHQKSASKAPKTCDFAYFTGQWGGGARAPRPPWLRYCLQHRLQTCLLQSVIRPFIFPICSNSRLFFLSNCTLLNKENQVHNQRNPQKLGEKDSFQM